MTARSKAFVYGRFLAGIAGSNLAGAWLSGCCECCVLSGRGFCVGRSLIQGSPTECGLPECVLETSTMRRTRATRAAEPWDWGRGVEVRFSVCTRNLCAM